MMLQAGESYDEIFADVERVIMPGVSQLINQSQLINRSQLIFLGILIKSVTESPEPLELTESID